MHVTSHPTAENEVLYWFADAPHLYQNLRSGFLKHTLILPQDIVQKKIYQQVNKSFIKNEYMILKYSSNTICDKCMKFIYRSGFIKVDPEIT